MPPVLDARDLLTICLDVSGTITISPRQIVTDWDGGDSVWFDDDDPSDGHFHGTTSIWETAADTTPRKIIIQGCPEWSANATGPNGKPRMIRRHFTPTNPQTITQQANRSKMRAALDYWATNNADARAIGQRWSKQYNLAPYHAFIKRYLTEGI